jgi:hypothetical protein
MLYFSYHALYSLGATQVYALKQVNDPTTEEEFKEMEYDSPNPISWQDYLVAVEPVKQRIGVEKIRIYRNKLLTETDWIMTTDNTNSIQNIQEWINYRQTLRDLPSNPPIFVWKNGELDISQMTLPERPQIIRNPSQQQAP